jgi:hypothetical protein
MEQLTHLSLFSGKGATMKIIIKNGMVKAFSDKGDLTEQLKNLEALVIATQRHAGNMHKVASRTLGVDPALVEANEALRRQVRVQENTIATADRQLARNKAARS